MLEHPKHDDPERLLLGPLDADPNGLKAAKPYTVEPQDLDELCRRAGPYADMIATHVHWSAITAWQMRDTGEIAMASGIPSAVAILSVFVVSKAKEYEAGWPSITGQDVTPVLYSYSADSQCEALRTAEEVRAAWEAAGRPYLNADRCKATYRHLIALIQEGRLDPIPGIQAEASINTSIKTPFCPVAGQ